MERRMMLALPGLAAIAATRAFSQTENQTRPGVSRKALTAHSGAKSTYKIPKSTSKLNKYLNGLTALLSLTPAQQQQASAILTDAASAQASIRSSLKSVRNTLSAAVMVNDTGGISQASASLAALMGQKYSNGALANAAVFQMLTPNQQGRLAQLHGGA